MDENVQHQARGRIDRIGTIFWGIHEPAAIVELVLTDYALCGAGKVSIDELKERAKARYKKIVEENK